MSCLDSVLPVKQTFFWLSSLQIRIRFDCCCCCLTFGERKEGKSISAQLSSFLSLVFSRVQAFRMQVCRLLENKCASTWQL